MSASASSLSISTPAPEQSAQVVPFLRYYAALRPFADASNETVRVTANLLTAAADEIEALRKGWQPIETAPKGGTKIDLLYPHPRGRAVDCHWGDYALFGLGWYWRTPIWEKGALLPEDQWSLNSYPNMQPTHWMYPPAPPSAAPADPKSDP